MEPLAEDRTSQHGKLAFRRAAGARILRSALVSRTDHLLVQAVRFGLVGAVATVCDMGVLWFLTETLHVMYLISAVFGFIVGLTVSYLLSVRWVFASRALRSKSLEFILFAVIGVAGLGLTVLILYACVELIGLHYMTGKMVAVVSVFAWNFGIRRAFLFRQGKSDGSG